LMLRKGAEVDEIRGAPELIPAQIKALILYSNRESNAGIK
jgi:hypothetical protein